MTGSIIGLMFFRTGSGYLTRLYNLIENCPGVNPGNFAIVVYVTSAAFVITVIVFFLLYNKIYMTVVEPEKSAEVKVELFADKSDFSKREREVFLLISESTVKFHICNILKKT